MMKRFMVLAGMVVVAMLFTLGGCSFDQKGETVAEGHRRHIRNVRLNRQAMIEDIDMVFLADHPSKLSERMAP